MKSGIIILTMIVIACLGSCSFIIKHIYGNKQFIDLDQKFNVAYIAIGDNKVDKVHISKWADFDKSDTIQITTTDGKVYYTHSSNVILGKE